MSAKSTEEKMEIMKAHAQGKKIQWRLRGQDKWQKVGPHGPFWDWKNNEYRVSNVVTTGGCTAVMTKVGNAFVALFAIKDDADDFIESTGLPHEYYKADVKSVDIPIGT